MEPWGLIDARPLVARIGPGEAAVAAIAAAQHGQINVGQLHLAALTDRMILTRTRRGTLHRRHRSVYAVGHDSDDDLGTLAAALLAVGPGAVISHAAAAYLAMMLASLPSLVAISLPRDSGHRRSRNGIAVHQPLELAGTDVTRYGVLPATTPARTLTDLAETDFDLVEAALNEGRATKAFTHRDLDRAIARNPSRLGAKRVAALLASESDPGFSRSGAERVLRRLLRRAGLPAPRRNTVVRGIELDLYWPEGRLNIEFDGFGTHGRRRSNFETDRDRDARLAAMGIQVIRVTWWQLTREAPKVVARVAAALALRTPTSGSA